MDGLSSESSDDEKWLPQRQVDEAPRVKKSKVKEPLSEEQKQRKKQRREEKRQLRRPAVPAGRFHTVSIAIPGSIIENAQSKELQTYLAGQVARAAVIFQVDEIVIYDDHLTQKESTRDCHVFLRRILQYVETPQYLRKALFPMHSELQYVGLLNPLDCPHHLRQDEWSLYREGVTVKRPNPVGSYVNIGLKKDVHVPTVLQAGVRVTVKLDESTKSNKKGRAYYGII